MWLSRGLSTVRGLLRGEKRSVTADYFKQLYEGSDDPWDYESSAYEKAKYAAVLDAMPRQRYRRGLEIACSNGVFTEMLADRCDRLLAIDISERAIALARSRCRDRDNVSFEVIAVPKQFPLGLFDFVNLGEVGYFWNSSDLRAAKQKIAESLEAGGHLQLVHTYQYKPGRQVDGETVHQTFRDDPAFRVVSSVRADEGYLLDVLEKV